MPVGGGLYGREIEYGDDGPSLDFFVVAVWDLTSGLHLVNGGGYDYLFGGDGDDILISTEGTAYLSGGNGTDTFVIQSSVGSEYIADFNTGDGDVIDLRHVLTGYNPLSDDLNDFLQISDSGGNSILSVDPDGTGMTNSFTQIATLNGVTGLSNVADLVTNGNLLAA